MGKNQIKIELLGTSFTISSEESEEYLRKIAAYMKEKISEVKERTDITDPFRIAILASLNIVDEYFKGKESNGQFGENEIDEYNAITERLIEQIDESLNVES